MSGLEDLGLPGHRRGDGLRSDEYREVIASVVSNIKDAKVARPKETKSVRVADLHEMTRERRTAIIKCVEEAMDLMGRTGKEVFLEMIYRRYGVVIDDVVDSPHKFIRALELVGGSHAPTLERHALDRIEQRLKVSASSLEEAVAALGGQTFTDGRSEKRNPGRKTLGDVKPRANQPGRFEYRSSFTP